jgi:DNA-binding FadR family transcriptional regulator
MKENRMSFGTEPTGVERPQTDRLDVTPTRQSRLYRDIADQLREAILSGRFEIGERLPTEASLASQYGVSRAVIRQATLNLEHECLVTVLVGARGGTYVRRSDPQPIIRALENHLRHQSVSVDDYLQAKRIIEPSVCDDIVRFSDRSHRARLQQAIDDFSGALDRNAGDEILLGLSLDFHDVLNEATGNPVLQALLSSLIRLAESVPGFTVGRNQDWPRIRADHQAILEALAKNDSRELRAILLDHLDSVGHIYGDGDPS